jgi:hypothetical protein
MSMSVAVASRFEDKEEAIGPYRFHVVIENTQENCYFTEKVLRVVHIIACCSHACGAARLTAPSVQAMMRLARDFASFMLGV